MRADSIASTHPLMPLRQQEGAQGATPPGPAACEQSTQLSEVYCRFGFALRFHRRKECVEICSARQVQRRQPQSALGTRNLLVDDEVCILVCWLHCAIRGKGQLHHELAVAPQERGFPERARSICKE